MASEASVDSGKLPLLPSDILGTPLLCKNIDDSILEQQLTDDTPGPNLNLTPEEKRVYGQLFRQADSDNVGVVTGEVAVKFFEKTRLDSRILGEVSLGAVMGEGRPSGSKRS
jgi:hypothetical protein